jgi:splicing factor 3B subunit 2
MDSSSSLPEQLDAGKKKPQRRRRAKAPAAPAHVASGSSAASAADAASAAASDHGAPPVDVQVIYLVQPEQDELIQQDDALKAAFARLTGLQSGGDAAEAFPVGAAGESGEPADGAEGEDGASHVVDQDGNVLSKRALRRLSRPTVAHLKQGVSRPAIVEVVDTTAADPELLVFLKGVRAGVAVPKHWQTSTKFLAGKRGSEKLKYELPDYIANTGITKLRDASDDSAESLKERMRDRARPKMGRIDIDYQVLHDAFFKLQTMPRLTRHGELYYEGKEFEKDAAKFSPGMLSDELRRALGMPTVDRDGMPAAVAAPPPWLPNMQRVGPPPSYPGHQFPGVNAPIPAGAHYGMHAGGWGKPPVDQFGRSLYGDVFGLVVPKSSSEQAIDKKFKWGGFVREDADEPAEEERRPESEEDEDEEGAEGDADDAKPVVVSDAGASIAQAPLTVGTDAQPVDLRKRTNAAAAAHRILEQTTAELGTGFFGAGHGYAVPAEAAAVAGEAVPVGEAAVVAAPAAASSTAAQKPKKFKF